MISSEELVSEAKATQISCPWNNVDPDAVAGWISSLRAVLASLDLEDILQAGGNASVNTIPCGVAAMAEM